MAAEEEWVVLETYTDPVQAEITVNFLRDHDVSVSVRGNTSTTSGINQLMGILNIRVVVPRAQLERARDVLAAMVGGDGLAEPAPELEGATTGQGPYRSVRAPETKAEPRPRSRIAGVFLAVLVPIGAGHFYARHNAAGVLFGAGILGCFFGGVLGGPAWLLTAAIVLVAFDAGLAPLACLRCNEERVPSAGQQRALAAAAIGASLLIGFALSPWQG